MHQSKHRQIPNSISWCNKPHFQGQRGQFARKLYRNGSDSGTAGGNNKSQKDFKTTSVSLVYSGRPPVHDEHEDVRTVQHDRPVPHLYVHQRRKRNAGVVFQDDGTEPAVSDTAGPVPVRKFDDEFEIFHRLSHRGLPLAG